MRTSSLASACLLALLGGAVVGREPDAFLFTKKGDYEKAYKAGAAEADRELKEGKATI
jgi:hypothetical protein